MGVCSYFHQCLNYIVIDYYETVDYWWREPEYTMTVSNRQTIRRSSTVIYKGSQFKRFMISIIRCGNPYVTEYLCLLYLELRKLECILLVLK